MAYDYDRLYGQTPEALGPPTKEIVDFFEGFAGQCARVLDVGCGQGRDAIFVARRGHRVTGVDISENGIRDMRAAVAREGLAIEAVVADIISYVPDGAFDVVLIDRTLHMLAGDARLEVLARLLGHVKDGGWLVIADQASNIAGFATVLGADRRDWSIERKRRGYLFARRR